MRFNNKESIYLLLDYYKDFIDIFNLTKAKELIPFKGCIYTIELEDRKTLPYSLVYNLIEEEL